MITGEGFKKRLLDLVKMRRKPGELTQYQEKLRAQMLTEIASFEDEHPQEAGRIREEIRELCA